MFRPSRFGLDVNLKLNLNGRKGEDEPQLYTGLNETLRDMESELSHIMAGRVTIPLDQVSSNFRCGYQPLYDIGRYSKKSNMH